MNEDSQLDTDGDNSVIGVSSVSLEGFRNYSELFLEISPGFNVLTGQNAQGKTNFLEALYLLSTTRLLRGQRDAEAIQQGRTRSTVSIQTLESDTQLGMTIEAGVKARLFERACASESSRPHRTASDRVHQLRRHGDRSRRPRRPAPFSGSRVKRAVSCLSSPSLRV